MNLLEQKALGHLREQCDGRCSTATVTAEEARTIVAIVDRYHVALLDLETRFTYDERTARLIQRVAQDALHPENKRHER